MPPRTDCSAAMSCGGFRLASDPRVASTGSRCAIDKAAVLHLYRACGPVVHPVHGLRQPDPPPIQVYPQALTIKLRGPETSSGPELSPISTAFPQRDVGGGAKGPENRTRGPCFDCGEQVPRYASRHGATRKASMPQALWITCAVCGIACAQPVGNSVDTKLFWPAFSV